MASTSSQQTQEKESSSGVAAPEKRRITRSACPMLNICANMGALPDDGQPISFFQYYTAIRTVGGTSPDVAAFLSLLGALVFHKSSVSLEELSKHNKIEHDASLTRGDWEEGKPGSGILRDEDMVQDIVKRADGEGYISLKDFARVRVEREKRTLERRGFPLDYRQRFLATGEVAFVMLFFGVDEQGRRGTGSGKRVKVHRDAFIAISEDRLPVGWEKPDWWTTNAVSVLGMGAEVAKLMKEVEEEEQAGKVKAKKAE